MIRSLEVSLGQVGGLSLIDPPGVDIPMATPGQIFTSGYYTDPITGQLYYYDATLDQWYYYAAGLYYPLATAWESASTVNPAAPISVLIGDTVQIAVSFKYQGPEKTIRLRGALGFGTTNTGTGSDSGQFQEGVDAYTLGFTVGPSELTAKSYTKTVDVVVPDRVWMPTGNWVGTAGRQLALYAKLVDGVSLELYKTLSVYLRGALAVAPVEPVFSEFSITNFVKV